MPSPPEAGWCTVVVVHCILLFLPCILSPSHIISVRWQAGTKQLPVSFFPLYLQLAINNLMISLTTRTINPHYILIILVIVTPYHST